MMRIFQSIEPGDTRDTFICAPVLNRIRTYGEVLSSPSRLSGARLAEKLKDIDVLIGGWGMAKLDSAALDKADKLQIVLYTGGSVAGFITQELYSRGVRVLSGNKLFAESVAEGTVAYMLAALRGIPKYNARVHAGEWTKGEVWNEGLLDSRVGLVGFGMIARYLTRMLQAFRCEVVACDPFVPDPVFAQYGVARLPLDELLKTCPIVSLHAAKSEKTRRLIDREKLALLQDGTLFVNTSRGSIIDETALCDELQRGRIRAVLDVYEREPLPAGSALRNLENVILIPHMAGPTVDRRWRVTMALLDDLDRYLKGEALEHEIPMEYGMRMTREG